MESILFIGRESSTFQAVAKRLPEGWSMLPVEGAGELKELLEKPGGGPPAILIDLDALPGWAQEVRNVAGEKTLVYGLISTPEQEEAALRAGADDTLLKPRLEFEIGGRLEGRLREREMLHRLSARMLQKERQAAVGRLVSFFCHDINNAMQASGGALELAREEAGASEDLEAYFNICRQETRRVVGLLERLRQVYRPQAKGTEAIQLDLLLLELLTMTADEMSASGVSVDGHLPSNLPPVRGATSQLSAAFLSILLNLCDAVGEAGGGELRYLARSDERTVEVELDALVRASTPGEEGRTGLLAYADELESILAMETARGLITANQGEVEISREGNGVGIRVRFPSCPA